MDENKDLEKELKQQELDQASQKTAHVAGKAAASHFGGALGNKVYDLASQTKVGQDLEKAVGKGLQNQPLAKPVMNALNKAGALDAAEKGIDIANADGISEKGDQLGNNLDTSKLNDINTLQNIKQNENEVENKDDNANSLIKLPKISKTVAIKIIAVISGLVCSLGLILIVIMAMYLAGYGIINKVKDFFLGIIDFFTVDQQELEEKFYKKLQTTQTKINQDYGICIDVNLITATLIVETKIEDFLNNGEIEVDNNDSSSDEEDTNYKRMTKQIELLAKMQIMTKKYSFDNSWKEINGSYCKNNQEEVLINSENESLFDKSNLSWLDNVSSLDSSTPDKISKNDEESIFNFYKKNVSKEKNYAYTLYYPKFNSDNSCNEEIPDDTYELSIGDYATMKDSVYYWNLVNSFIPDYYNEYLPEDEPERTKKINEIAEQIYSLYDTYGPSQTCATSYQGPSALCPNGITLVNKDGTAQTLDFEEYIAGVVSNEAYTTEGMEALKAQAVAARTYAINLTNYCEKTITNSTNNQTYTNNINDQAREATASTAGEILIDANGNIFSSQYDSFCYDDSDCPDAKKNADGTYTVTYTKLPNGEKHTVTLNDSSQYGRITHGQGHARGMSQLVSYQMAKEGKNYKEILSYFYSDGVTISLVLSPSNTDGATIIDKPIEQYLSAVGTNINNMNQTIYSQVRKSGVGTREGVVAAAVTLINNFYSQTGYLLPYELYPSGKYSGYGMDPSWGTNTGRSDYPSNGLDCSGFVSWAIHNGGFKYEVKSAKGWGDSSVKRPWTKGMTDNSARPGDLIYNEPQSANGTTGHIRMIVEVNKEGYVIAEASGRKNGVRIKTISFTSTGNYYLVNMDNYYGNATKVTDYPQ